MNNDSAGSTVAEYVLPPSVMGASDISRLLRELEQIDYDCEAQSIRNPNAQIVPPAASQQLVELAEANGLSHITAPDRSAMTVLLRHSKEKSPTIYFTFATDPDQPTRMQLVQWVRQNLHPLALVGIGIQPHIVGGCIVRTPSHIYDYSLRVPLRAARATLRQKLEAL